MRAWPPNPNSSRRLEVNVPPPAGPSNDAHNTSKYYEKSPEVNKCILFWQRRAEEYSRPLSRKSSSVAGNQQKGKGWSSDSDFQGAWSIGISHRGFKSETRERPNSTFSETQRFVYQRVFSPRWELTSRFPAVPPIRPRGWTDSRRGHTWIVRRLLINRDPGPDFPHSAGAGRPETGRTIPAVGRFPDVQESWPSDLRE